MFQLISLNQKQQKAFLWIFLISLLSLSSLLQSNVLYQDDLYRVMDGKTYWEQNGRPIASISTILLQMGTPITDISPLPQIIGITLYSLSVIYIAKLFKIDNLVILTLSGIIFVINPYNLSLYSFTFDSFPMGLGVFSSIMAFYLVTITIKLKANTIQKIFVFLFSIFLLLISLCLYQPTSSFYLVSFLFYLLAKLGNETDFRKSFNQFLIYLAILLFSFFSYIPIKNIYIKGDYNLVSSQLPPINKILKIIIHNILVSWEKVIYSLGNSIILFLMILLLILITITIFIHGFNNKFEFKIFELISCLLLKLFYYFILICSFMFPSTILLSPPFSPRIFTGFTAVVGIGCLYLGHYWSFSKFSWLKYLLIFHLSLIVLSFANISLTYGNVLHHQEVYEQRIGTLMIADIQEASSKLSLSSDKPKISFVNSETVGNLKTNVLNRKALEKYPILKSLDIPYFNPNNFIKMVSFSFEFEAHLSNEFIDKKKGYYIPKNEPIINRQLYNIYLENGDTFIILFKE